MTSLSEMSVGMVAADALVDLAEVERWSYHEGMAEEFERIKGLLKRST